jgi:hypothetical protein
MYQSCFRISLKNFRNLEIFFKVKNLIRYLSDFFKPKEDQTVLRSTSNGAREVIEMIFKGVRSGHI